jgi:hypothetical protein
MNNVLKKTIPDMFKHFARYKKFDTEETWQKKAEECKLKKPKNSTWKKVCEKYAEKLCEECHVTKGKYNEYHDKKLCFECSSQGKYELICKSIAKKEYHLNDTNLQDLKHITVKNPHCKKANGMRLYSKDDVRKAFREKNQIDEDDEDDCLVELNKKRSAKGAKIKNTVIKNKNERKQGLLVALQANGLKLRKDSKLCNGYIDGTLREKWSIDSIVERMCQMKYLYDYCDMNHAYELAKARNAEEFNAGYFPDVPIIDLAEDIALEKNGGRYPDVWPWQA